MLNYKETKYGYRVQHQCYSHGDGRTWRWKDIKRSRGRTEVVSKTGNELWVTNDKKFWGVFRILGGVSFFCEKRRATPTKGMPLSFFINDNKF